MLVNTTSLDEFAKNYFFLFGTQNAFSLKLFLEAFHISNVILRSFDTLLPDKHKNLVQSKVNRHTLKL